MENLCEAELELKLSRATQVGESVGLCKASGIVMDEAKEEFAKRGNTDTAKILRNIAMTILSIGEDLHPGPPNDFNAASNDKPDRNVPVQNPQYLTEGYDPKLTKTGRINLT